MKLNVTFSGDQTNRRSEKKEEFIKGGYDMEQRQYRPKQVPAPSGAKEYDIQRDIQTQSELAIMQMSLFNQLVGAKCTTIANKLAPMTSSMENAFLSPTCCITTNETFCVCVSTKVV